MFTSLVKKNDTGKGKGRSSGSSSSQPPPPPPPPPPFRPAPMSDPSGPLLLSVGTSTSGLGPEDLRQQLVNSISTRQRQQRKHSIKSLILKTLGRMGKTKEQPLTATVDEEGLEQWVSWQEITPIQAEP
ncbi:hypothetical protein BGZ83_004496 [Gryganskiella cystojenkinii]|nr:hypothetical protein BGZ83_004496 [Gryganskiella cystojenkinii]